MLSSLTNFALLSYKTNKILCCCGSVQWEIIENIKMGQENQGTTWPSLTCHLFALTTFDIICDIWLNRHMETCKSGYLQCVPHDTISLEKLEGFQFWEVIKEGSVTIPSLSKYKKINYHLKMVFCSSLLMLLLLLLKTHLYTPKTQDNCCEITNIVRKMTWNYETWQTLALTLQWEQTNPLMFSTTPKTGIFVFWQKVSSLLTSLTATP